ncbi:MAG: hypothetical protein QNK37_20575 [Acidobacteriota bacterium]|nr:hypothetical protein [Acidobacteriota bacterium]
MSQSFDAQHKAILEEIKVIQARRAEDAIKLSLQKNKLETLRMARLAFAIKNGKD